MLQHEDLDIEGYHATHIFRELTEGYFFVIFCRKESEDLLLHLPKNKSIKCVRVVIDSAQFLDCII